MGLYRAKEVWTGTLASSIPDGTTNSFTLTSSSGLTNGETYVFTIDRVDANGTKTPNKKEVIIGTVSGSNVINCVRGVEGTAQAHSAGAIVEILFTAKHWNDLIESYKAQHREDGSHKKIQGLDNNQAITQKDSGGTEREILKVDNNNKFIVGNDNLTTSLKLKIYTATQNSGVSSSTGTLVDLTGASLSLEAGTYLIIANFQSARFWTSGGTPPRVAQARYCVRDSNNNVLLNGWDTIAQYGDESPREIGKVLVGVITLSSPTTIKMSGYINVQNGTNFSSGFRIDSGTSGVQWSSLTAIRLT